jgi:DNA mismatch repair protein MutL
MGTIRILPEILSNKIAAGEVVERPASVVKELLENSLDARADRITIDIETGGRKLISVGDNGVGMQRDEALLAIERYATSKISSEADLAAIRTLGFRGEALPSIASVSRFAMTTRAADQPNGVTIDVVGGKLVNVQESGAPRGTLITVRQLFFNTPARRKYLKSAGTEMGHIVDTVARQALARPAVRFQLVHNQRTVKEWPAAPDGVVRVADVLGRQVRHALHAITSESPWLKLTGWVADSRVHRSTSRGIYLYVNGRFVRDRVIQHALMQGYSERLMKGRFPLAVLFLALPLDQVDVNVHPTKHEVRFARQKQVHDGVVRAVREVLARVESPRWHVQGAQKPSGRPIPPQVQEFPVPLRRQPDTAPETVSEPPAVFAGPPADSDAVAAPVPPPEQAPPGQGGSAIADTAVKSQSSLWPEQAHRQLRVIGQLLNTYVLCEGIQGLVLIDQHAAHERVYYEQLLSRTRSERPRVQQLLVPETIEVGYREAQVLSELLAGLAEAGLKIESFGGTTFIVTAVPLLLEGAPIGPLIAEMAERAVSIGITEGPAPLLDACLKVMACHGAIRAHQSLTVQHLEALLKQLAACRNPAHCPHGRPTWITVSLGELEKRFGRRV